MNRVSQVLLVDDNPADTDLARDTLPRSPWPSQVRAVADGVFSTSWTGLDVARSFELGANSYVSKPGNLHDFVTAVESISAFWFGCAYLMRKEDK
jgi:CheY-like chemotaxis protein